MPELPDVTIYVERLRARVVGQALKRVRLGSPFVLRSVTPPCRVCEAPVQRIVYTSNEANYCARCQTGGRLLSDRSLSRLLKSDWPRSLDELDQMTAARQTDVGPAS